VNIELVATVALASLLGSLHCVGMCGGFVAFYSAGSSRSGIERNFPHVAYHLGRLLTYTAWGLTAGSIGALLDVAGHAVGIGRVGAIMAGLVMVAWGSAILASKLGLRRMRIRGVSRWRTRLSRALSHLAERPPTIRAFLLGLSSTLLPCGFLYAFVVAAAGTGSAVSGAMVMGAFWFGTVPLLFGLGLGVEHLGARLRQYVPTFTAVLMLGLGTYTVIGRVNVSAVAAKHLETVLHGMKTPASPSLPKRTDCPCHHN
jgi:uncharacterized protein